MEAYCYERTTWAAGETPLSAENMNNIEDWIAYVDTHLLDLIYPVGAIYLSVNDVTPETLLGGTWERIEDRFLLAAGSTYTAGDTGGAATVALTQAQIPSHTHKMPLYNSGTEASGYGLTKSVNFQDVAQVSTTAVNAMRSTQSTGSGSAHNNMPPYLAVYVWKRTA